MIMCIIETEAQTMQRLTVLISCSPQGLLLMDIVILVFGVLSATQLSHGDAKFPGYPWLLLCRFGVGVGAGGVPQA